MKTILIRTIILSVLSINLYAQTKFQKKFHIAYQDFSCTIGSLNDGSSIISSIVIISNFAQWDFNLTRIDSVGNILWSKTYGSPTLADEGYFPVQISDNNFIITGGSPFGTNGGVLLAKIDYQNGNVIWSKSIGGNGSEVTYAPSVETHDKGFAIASWTSSIGAGNYDFYLMRTDSLGNLLWAKSYGGTGYEDGAMVIETKDNGFILAGRTVLGFNAQGEDIFVVKTDSLGNLLWAKKYGGSLNDYPFSINETPDNGYLLSARTYSFGNGDGNLLLIKTDINGTVQWSKVYENFIEGLYSKVTSNFEIVAGGTVRDSALSFASACTIKTDSLGNIIWNKIYSRNFIGTNVEPTSDGGYVQIGCVGSYDTLLVIKSDANGNSDCYENSFQFTVISPTIIDTSIIASVDSGGSSISTTLASTNILPYFSNCLPTAIEFFSLDNVSEFNIFPNPNSGIFTIEISDFISKGVIEIYNVVGEIIFSSNINSTARKEIILKNISAGIYFIKVFDGDKSYCKKLIVERN